jgi:aminopeptidase N
VSERRALRELSDKDYGEARDFLDNCHELSHFWWNVVDTATPNDWINEGLAEFSAFTVAQERYGKPFAEVRMAEYRQHAAQSKTTSAIAETEGNSPDRYVNRYEKTTLMFLEARRRFGEEALFRFLSELFARFAGTHQATTELFLQQVRKSMGAEAETFFREELFRTPQQAL